jgi:hypothetical protein
MSSTTHVKKLSSQNSMTLALHPLSHILNPHIIG